MMYSTACLCAGACHLLRFLTVVACLYGAPRRAEAAEIHVGTQLKIKTLAEAVRQAEAGDTILLQPGLYLDDSAVIDVPLIIQGQGRNVTLRVTHPIRNRKGILVVNAALTVRNIVFENAYVADSDGKNGAGIRHQSGDLTVTDCIFRGNQNGILAGADSSAHLYIDGSDFIGNGAGDGFSHALYVGAVASLTVENSRFNGTKVGHNIKSRALKTRIKDTMLEDGVDGSTSYAIDLPNGGDAELSGLSIVQGIHTGNAAMVAFGAEKQLHPRSSLTVRNSVFASRRNGAIGIHNFTTHPAIISHSDFENVATPLRGAGRLADQSH